MECWLRNKWKALKIVKCRLLPPLLVLLASVKFRFRDFCQFFEGLAFEKNHFFWKICSKKKSRFQTFLVYSSLAPNDYWWSVPLLCRSIWPFLVLTIIKAPKSPSTQNIQNFDLSLRPDDAQDIFCNWGRHKKLKSRLTDALDSRLTYSHDLAYLHYQHLFH